jgi:hypothetical protein
MGSVSTFFSRRPLLPFVKLKSRDYDLDITSGKISVGGDGSNPIPFTSRPDIARYLSYVLTRLPADQLKNRSFYIRGDTKVHVFRFWCLDVER